MTHALAVFLFKTAAHVDGVDVEVPDVRSGLRVLEVDVVSERVSGSEYHPENADGCGPSALLLSLSSSSMVIGRSGHEAMAIDSIDVLHRVLERFKGQRPDQVELILQVDDDVDHARLIAVLDEIHGFDLYPSVVLSPTAPVFTLDDWRSPVAYGAIDPDWNASAAWPLTWWPEPSPMPNVSLFSFFSRR